MKKALKALIISNIFFSPLYSYIQTTRFDDRFSSIIELSLGAMQYMYNEPGVMNIKSFMPTLGINIVLMPDSIFAIVLGAKGGYGINGKYDGFVLDLQNNTKMPVTYNSNDNMRDMYATFNFSGSLYGVYLGGGLGAGYYLLKNSVDSNYAYNREQSYLYAIANVNISYIYDRFATKFDMNYKNIIYAHHFSQMTKNGFDKDLDLYEQSGNGLDFSFEVGTKIYGTFSSIRLIYSMWNVSDSESIRIIKNNQAYNFMEPHNLTHKIGMEVSFQF